jgi:ubiquinone/menaquinone biosynthesis C-methylase UbiE
VADRVDACAGDVHRLAFPQGAFDLVLAIGVIPWLDSPQKAIDELARVVKSSGYLLVTADNSKRLDVLLDPLKSPGFSKARQFVKKVFRISWWNAASQDGVCSFQHSVEEMDRFVGAARLKKISAETVGFGPFTVLDHNFLPDSIGVRTHNALQFLAKLRLPGVYSAGSHILMLAQKCETGEVEPR